MPARTTLLLLLIVAFTSCTKEKRSSEMVSMTVDGTPTDLSNNIYAQLHTINGLNLLEIFGFDNSDPAARVHLFVGSLMPITTRTYINSAGTADPWGALHFSPDGDYFQPMREGKDGVNPLKIVITSITLDHVTGIFSGQVEKDGLVKIITEGSFSVEI